jgi:molybdenum-dependent DNA-binding transcriptional regulator ModE
MKKALALMMVCCSLVVFATGCEDGGGSVVQEAQQSEIEAYMAREAEEQAKMAAEMGDATQVPSGQ